MPRKEEAPALEDTQVGPDVPQPDAAPEAEEPKWKKALIVVGRKAPPADFKGAVIIVEQWSDPVFAEGSDDVLAKDGEPKVSTEGYSTKGDVYLRSTEDVRFPESAAEVLTLGVNVYQGGFGGFTRSPGYVNVGPANPIFAAANLAWQRGAEKIEIDGATKRQRAALETWFAGLSGHKTGPAEVDISFT